MSSPRAEKSWFIAAFIAATLANPIASTAAEDPCDFFGKVKIEAVSEDSFKQSFGKLIKELTKFFSSPSIETFSTISEPHFTIDRGYLLTLTCEDEKKRLERSIFYPVGLVVFPIGERVFSNRKSIETTYTYVVTEYGLRAFLPRAHIRPIEKDGVYLFGNGAVPVPYCAGQPCNTKAGRQINARSSYAKIRLGLENQKLLHKMLVTRQFTNCGPYSIEPFYKRGTPTGERGAKIKLCEEEGKRNGNLKIVDYQLAKDKFSYIAKGSFQRFGSSVLSKKIPFLVSLKKCSQQIEDNKILSIGGSLNGKLDFLIFDAQLSGGTIFKRTVIDVLKEGTYHLFSSYTAEGVWSQEATVFDIRIIADCKGSIPSELQTLNIYFGKKDIDFIPLIAKRFEEGYSAAKLENGLFWQSRVDAQKLKGKFWLIAGYDQYIRWRGFLRQQLFAALSDKFEPAMTLDRKKAIVDFYTHIILSAVFDFLDPQEAEDYIAEFKSW